jgi:ABC-type polysaccharide/polyol phosphate export permease
VVFSLQHPGGPLGPHGFVQYVYQRAAYIILMFLSTMFYPMDQLPTWFRTLAWLNPMTWQVDVLRFTLLGVGPVTTVLMESRDFLHSR